MIKLGDIKNLVILRKEKDDDVYYDVIVKDVNGREWHAISDTLEVDIATTIVSGSSVAMVQMEFICLHLSEVIKK